MWWCCSSLLALPCKVLLLRSQPQSCEKAPAIWRKHGGFPTTSAAYYFHLHSTLIANYAKTDFKFQLSALQLPSWHLVRQQRRAPGRSWIFQKRKEKKKEVSKENAVFAVGQCLQVAAFVEAVMFFHQPHIFPYRSEADANIPYSL